MPHSHTTKFTFGDKVLIDGCPSLIAVVTGIRFFQSGSCEYTLEYFNEGTPITMNAVDEWRMTHDE